jgi:hypothetical protein
LTTSISIGLKLLFLSEASRCNTASYLRMIETTPFVTPTSKKR